MSHARRQARVIVGTTNRTRRLGWVVPSAAQGHPGSRWWTLDGGLAVGLAAVILASFVGALALACTGTQARVIVGTTNRQARVIVGTTNRQAGSLVRLVRRLFVALWGGELELYIIARAARASWQYTAHRGAILHDGGDAQPGQ